MTKELREKLLKAAGRIGIEILVARPRASDGKLILQRARRIAYEGGLWQSRWISCPSKQSVKSMCSYTQVSCWSEQEGFSCRTSLLDAMAEYDRGNDRGNDRQVVAYRRILMSGKRSKWVRLTKARVLLLGRVIR